MSKQAFNPYLPLDTYIPDGEPHVFGDRVYVYGSHDKEGGDTYCMLDYECWSAPVDDLRDWRCEGTIYRKEQDPTRDEKHQYLYAPDVVQGVDGRYYLYYSLCGPAFCSPMQVAVCDTPAGKFEYYGEIHNPDGTTFDRNVTFDPAVINDNGQIWLYYGWAIGADKLDKMSPVVRKLMKKLAMPALEKGLFAKTGKQIRRDGGTVQGAYAVRLAEDMLTVLTEPVLVVPGQIDAYGSDFEGHAFFEASSIRKVGDLYYFIYSSQVCHELCYATSKYPDRDFKFGGVIVSNGDVGINGRKPEDRLAMAGNNHGSIERINGKWYIFYHRHTNKTSYSRQGCAEEIVMNVDGSIPQVEMTSCGLNGGPLKAEGTYHAPICCNLTNGKMPFTDNKHNNVVLPHITCRAGERIIAEFGDNCMAGYKYFDFEGRSILTVTAKGTGEGILTVKTGDAELAKIEIHPAENWTAFSAPIEAYGKQALYLCFAGTGLMEMKEISFEK